MRIGLLAYGAIGDEHSSAILSTPGLELTAVCDTNPERVEAALTKAPSATGFADAQAMLDSGLLDGVVISTPPNTHADWARAALDRGMHVIVEKPMALTRDECDDLMARAEAAQRTLLVYQNRRFDQDFVTIRRLIGEGAIGEVFSFDTFVGGYSRPCDYWHSDVAVSGGAIFDWGSHFIDQILSIMTAPIAHVSGLNHKRHWTHVTNADHATVTITFTDGTVATFTHSDLAAARRPKYHVLGTTGAIVGEWDLRAEPAVADLPALVHLYDTSGDSRLIPLDEVEPFGFHREFAGLLLDGTPTQVQTVQSRNVVAVMQAAEESAAANGIPVVPDLA